MTMLIVYTWNYIVIILIACIFYYEPFFEPLVVLLVAQITTTYMLEATETYVPPIIRNILLFWYVFMQLCYAVPVFAGVCIGLMQGL